MPVNSNDGVISITGNAIELARWTAVKGALSLEMRGMTRRGRSAFALTNDILVNNGKPKASNKQKAHDALVALIDEKRGEMLR